MENLNFFPTFAYCSENMNVMKTLFTKYQNSSFNKIFFEIITTRIEKTPYFKFVILNVLSLNVLNTKAIYKTRGRFTKMAVKTD